MVLPISVLASEFSVEAKISAVLLGSVVTFCQNFKGNKGTKGKMKILTKVPTLEILRNFGKKFMTLNSKTADIFGFYTKI